jgi:site-specific DNA-methyltransferase (adenine-specific)
MGDIQVFQRNDDTVFWGDALDVLEQRIPDRSVNLIFADPPYNLGKKFSSFVDRWPSDLAYVEWCKRWLDLCFQKLTETGSLYLMASTQCMPYLDIHIREHLSVLSRIVWHYDSSGVQAKKYYGSAYEPILFCVKNPQNYTFNSDAIVVEARTGAQRKLIDYRKPKPALYNSWKVPGNVWYFPRVRYRMLEYEHHPSQKPEALLERIVKASSNPGDTVLDPFAGTFTTLAVAQRLGRSTIGIEIEEEYVKVGLRRLQIADELNGSRLAPPRKTCARKNGAGRSKASAIAQGGLF